VALTPGFRLGVYEVSALLGEGGMGEVYRATDSTLKRQVAIKVLPASLAGDADRLARFQREAEALAALNHPNIAAIYGLERLDGQEGRDGQGTTSCIVMELVEGEDLSHKLQGLRAQGKGLPIDEALPIAKQIAEALEAAHEQGIIHRDLKPANIKVRPDGTVKVLDFGLAKAIDQSPASSPQFPVPGLSMSPTIMSPVMSGVGVILGTAAYMAPEQAKGRAVDKRADIWAFGVVLYEMLTGRRLFEAEDVSETLAAVLTRDVRMAALPAAVPAQVQTLLRDCLARDPKQRLRDIGDARLTLEKIIAGAPDEATAVAASPAPMASSSSRALPWMIALVLAAAAVALAIPASRYLRQSPPLETRLDIVTPATVQPASFALSPDGRQIVFVATDDKTSRLWLRSLSSTTAQPLAGTDGATLPFWSPDGRSIGFFAANALKRLDLGGSAPQTLAPAPNGNGGTWNADGVIVYSPNNTSPLLRVAASGGAPAAVTILGAQQTGQIHPQFLPDGRRLVFLVAGTTDVSGVYLAGLDGRSPVRLTAEARTSAVYASPGFLVWGRAGTLVAQKVDIERSVLVGEPVTLTASLADDVSYLRSAVSVSANGLIAFRTASGGQRQLTWFDRSGAPQGVVGGPDSTQLQPRLSPDGRRVAVVRGNLGNPDIWLLDGARASRFTFDPGQDWFATWSPDGTRLVYRSRGIGGPLYMKLTSGAGVEEQFLATDQTLTASSWSPDGRFLMYMSIDPKTNADLWVIPMTGDAEHRKPFVFLKTPFREAYGTFSPDSRWVAYHSNESGRPEVYVRSFTPPGATPASASAAAGQWQISTTGGILPMWRSDGKELYYVNPDGALMAVPIAVTATGVEPGTPVMLFQTHMFGGGADVQLGWQYDVARDGRFLINTLVNDTAAPITLIQNWQPDAKK
jgi:Tol biopolymer transport system component